MLISSDICADGLPGVAGESQSAQRDPFTHVSLELKCAQHAVDQIKMVIMAQTEEGEAKLRAQYDAHQRVVRLLHLPWGRASSISEQLRKMSQQRLSRSARWLVSRATSARFLRRSMSLCTAISSTDGNGQAALLRANLRAEEEAAGAQEAGVEDETDVRPEFLQRSEEERERDREIDRLSDDLGREMIDEGVASLSSSSPPSTFVEE